MKLNKYSLFLASATAVALAGCDKEAAFNMNPGEGQLNCRTLTVDYINNNPNVRSSGVELGDFTVSFVNTETNDTARSFLYSLMPEIVSLPEGSYRAEASYGDNPIAEWEAPYYLGDTDFEIHAGEITNDIDPVECVLSNIRVRVNISDLNLGLLGDDAKVVVHAGKEGQLEYNTTTTNKAGYFRFVENSHTLTAEFSGTVDGKYVNAIPLIYNNVESGKAYDINFNINRPDNMEPGAITIGGDPGSEISINATIAIMDQTKEIDPNEPEDNILVDDMRPVDGSGSGEEPGTDPDDPNQGETPSEGGPEIKSDVENMVLGKPYEIVDADSTPVKFSVTSETGITEFKIEIDSSTLTADELEGVGLTNKLDLINPVVIDPDTKEVVLDYEAKLNGLGFPTRDKVKGKTSLEFNISQFVPLLLMLDNSAEVSGDHQFKLSVSDASGTSKAIVYLKTKI